MVSGDESVSKKRRMKTTARPRPRVPSPDWIDELQSYENVSCDCEEEEDTVDSTATAKAMLEEILTTLKKDSLDRVKLIAAIERNTKVLDVILEPLEKVKEKNIKKEMKKGAEATRRNTDEICRILKEMSDAEERRKTAAGPSTNMELVVAGPVRNAPGGVPGVKPVEDLPSPVMK